MDNVFTFTAVGLAFDGIGVAILGYAFFSKSVAAMMVESGSYYGGNDALLYSLIQSRTDGVAGTALLIAGFILQWFGFIGIASVVVGQLLLAVLVILLLLYSIFLRNRLISIQVSRGERLRQEQLKG